MTIAIQVHRPASLFLAFVFVFASASWPADATPKRLTTLFDETVTGTRQPSSSAEVAFLSALRAAGIPLVDEAQSRKIRSTTDAGTVLASGVSSVITSLDADVIVAAVCTVTKLESDLLGQNALRYDAVIEAKVLSVDTGAVIAAVSVQGAGLGFSDKKAAADAAKKAGEALAKEVLPQLEAFGAVSRVELTVEGSPNVSAWDAVVRGLEQIPGVNAVEVLQAGRGMSKVALETDGVSARDLAVAFDANAALGLDVFGYSATAIKAAWSAERALDLAVFVAPFEASGPGAAWKGRVLAGVAAAPLANVGFARFPVGMEAVGGGSGPKAWTALAKKNGVPVERAVVVVGSVRSEGRYVAVEARVVTAEKGEALVARQATCAVAEASACAAKVGDELAAALSGAVVQKRHLFGRKVADALAKAAGARGARPLEIVALEVGSLFPARLVGAAAETPVRLKVKNGGDKPLTNVVARATLAGLSKDAVDTPLGDLAPGEEREVLLKIVLQPEALAARKQAGPAVVRAEVDYSVDGFEGSQARTTAVVVHGANALSWDEPASAASFVTPRSHAVQAAAQAAVSAVPARLARHPLATPAALFSILSASGLGYAHDPAAPFGAEAIDDVQLPTQTLAARKGDCDDLAVLYASLVEATGRAAVLVLTPGHVFVAVDTERPTQSSFYVALADNDVLTWNSRAWLPVETTALDAGFAGAWAKGAAEVAKWQQTPGKLQIVDVREAWAWFAPLDGDLGQGVPNRVDVDAIALASAKGVTDTVAAWRARVDLQVARVDEDREPGRKARLLVAAGRLDEARELFERRTGARSDLRDWNNAGNIAVLAKEPSKGLESYAKALALEATNAFVHANAAVASFVLGDDDLALEHLAACLAAGRQDLVEQISRSGTAGLRAGAGDDLASRDLGSLARRALEKAGVDVPEAKGDARAADRADDAPDAVTNLLHWL